MKKILITAAGAMLLSPVSILFTAAPAHAAPCAGAGHSVQGCQDCMWTTHNANGLCMFDSPVAPNPAIQAAQAQCSSTYPNGIDAQICADNVARGFPPDNIRRP
jgi:hypothetical protein